MRLRLVPVLALLLAAAPPVWAEEANKGGLPQLDFTLYPGQLFWLALSFGLLYLLMARVALPSVQQTQDRRQSTLQADLKTAAEAGERVKAMEAHEAKALAEARAKAQATVAEMSQAAQAQAAESQQAQNQALAKRIAEAEGAIRTARSAALAEAPELAQQLATDIIGKVARA